MALSKKGWLMLATVLVATPGITQVITNAPPLTAAQPHVIIPDKVWPFSAEHVDYAALQKLPDWRGTWSVAFGAPVPGAPPPEQPQLIGKYKAHFEELQALIKSGDPEAMQKVERRSTACEPPGVPNIMTQPYDIEFLFNPGRVTIIQEAYMQVRRIYTDGRPLPEDPDPTYNGSSIGHWEGDTLVVTTVGLRDGAAMGRAGVTHSDQLKLTERMHLDPANKDILVVENTFVDPKALAAPFHSVSRFKRQRSLDQLEFICAQNDRNPLQSNGVPEFLDPKH